MFDQKKSTKNFPDIFRKFSIFILFDMMKKYFLLRFFFTCWIMPLHYQEIIRTLREVFAHVSRGTRFCDFSKNHEKSWNLARFHSLFTTLWSPQPEFSPFPEQLFSLWPNWSHGSKGRTSEKIYFPTFLYIVIDRKSFWDRLRPFY